MLSVRFYFFFHLTISFEKNNLYKNVIDTWEKTIHFELECGAICCSACMKVYSHLWWACRPMVGQKVCEKTIENRLL